MNPRFSRLRVSALAAGVSAVLALCAAAPGRASSTAELGSFVDVAAARQTALAAERGIDWQTAYDSWQRILDRGKPTDEQRAEAIAHVHDLKSKVRPENTDPKRARSWPALVVIFRNIDFTYKDKAGAEHRFRSHMTDDEVATIQKGFRTYQDYVFQFTSGILRVDPTFKVVDEPVTQFEEEDGRYWLGPFKLKETFRKLMGGKKFQSVFSYEKFNEGGDRLPPPFLGGTYGADCGLDAGFSELIWSAGSPVNGEAELHEWLHQIDWMFTAVLGYPQAASVNPDTGRDLGAKDGDGDPDYRRSKLSLNWMDFYVHIMQDHVTREMWREATMFKPAPNPWLAAKAPATAAAAAH